MHDRHNSTKRAVVMLGVLAIALLGCKGLSRTLGGQSSPSAAASAAPPVTAPSATTVAAPALPPSKNRRVVDLVDEVRLFCHYSAQGIFDRCSKSPIENGARVAGTDLLNDPSFVETLSVVLVEEKNPRLVLAAAELLARSEYHVFTGLDPAKNPKADAFVSAATGQRLLTALRSVPQAAQAVRPIVWIASARELTKDVVETLKQLPGDAAKASEARRRGMASLLEFGRLPAFEHVKALAASGNPDDAEAAARAPTRMRKPTPAEIAAVCPWLKELLSQKDEDVSSSAAHSMLYVCAGEFPALLANFERRVTAVSVTQSTLQPFNSVCRRPNPQAKPADEDEPKPLLPSAEQCAAMFAEVQKVVDDARFDKHVRVLAFSILSERADDETLRVCTAWKAKSRSDDFRIPEAASDCVKRVNAARAGK